MLRKCRNNLPELARHISVFLPRLVAQKLHKVKPIVKKAFKSKAERVDVKTIVPLNVPFFSRIIGAPYIKWQNILRIYPGLQKLKPKDIENTTETLKSMKFETADILSTPVILFYNSSTIENRYKVLVECGVEKITISLLAKYVTVMNKTVAHLKSHGYIAYETDVKALLESYLSDIHLIKKDINYCETQELKVIRQNILNNYLRQRLNMSNDDITKLWKCYMRVRHKSFSSLRKNIKFILEELNFSKERIVKNAFLLYGDEDNMRRILTEIKTIDRHDVRTILYKRPKILMSSCDALLQTLKHVKTFGISEEAILRCLDVLTLGPDTVLERLQDLSEIEEFEVLGTNPRILRLVHYQNKARLRLEYLSQLKVRCASLHILSCGSEAFAKFAREGADRTKGRDIVVYLSKVMGRDETAIRNLLSRHPNWCHIPALNVKQCFDFLISKNFSFDNIYRNVHILLYPIKRIDEKLFQLLQPDFFEGMQIGVSYEKLNKNEILTLVLYFIECEFHFTGDGIWSEQQTHQVENFNNLLPDFPESQNKDYRYGTKPAIKNVSNKLQI